MEIKKSPKADLEGKKSTWLLVGYVLVLALMVVAFEWSERDKQVTTDTGIQKIVFEEEIIPVTEQEQPKQAPPPPAAPPVEEVLEIVDDKADVEETTIQASDNQEAVEIKYVPVEVEEEEVDEQEIFQVVENMPEFPGGMGECMKFLSKNVNYPSIAQENGIQGRVIIQFVVNTDGSIVDAVVARGVDPYLDKEALRVVGKMPKWTPGKQRGKAVRVRYTLPVMFRLQ